MLAMGVHAMGIYLMFWPLIGFQVITSGYFQATGRPAWAMLLSLSRQVLFLIPLVVFLPRFYGLDGVWWAMPVSDLLSVILSVTVFIRELRFLRSDRPYTGTA
jgi:Na+-driven multidrug efflux pump